MSSRAEVIQVIRTRLATRGRGTSEDPFRTVEQFWSLDGVLLAQNDSGELHVSGGYIHPPFQSRDEA